MSSENQWQHGFLEDYPSSKDMFSSRGHEKVAKAIANWIKGGGTANAIALEGGLGSGKSSVVRIAREYLPEKDKHWVFTFDLFLHKNEYVRRAFLEQLIEFVKRQGGTTVPEKKLDEIQKKVTKKKTEIIKDQRIKFAFSGLILSGLFAVALIFLTSLSDALLIKEYNVSESTRWLGYGGALLCVIFYLYVRYQKKKNEHDDKWSWEQLFIKDTGGTYTDEYLTDPEVTEVELEHYFRQVLELIPDGRRIVIVLDNIDRIPMKEVLETWRNLDIFIGASKGGGEKDAAEKESNVALIVPYDSNRLTKAFGQSFTDMNGDSGREARIIANEYINKRFPIRVLVPKLLITEWHDYFDECCTNESLDELLLKDLRTIYDELKYSSEVSPRHIKQFCNDLQVMQCIDVGRKPVLSACYVLRVMYRGDSIEDLVANDEALLKNEFTPLALRTLNGVTPDWREEIAAMHYNTTTEKAVAILLDSKLDKAISRRDVAGYTTLNEKHGFELALQRVMEKILSVAEFQGELDSFFSLQAKQEQPLSLGAKLDIWRMVEARVDMFTCWKTPEPALKNIKTVFPKRANSLFKRLEDSFSQRPEEVSAELWLTTNNALANVLSEKEYFLMISSEDLFQVYFEGDYSHLPLSELVESDDSWNEYWLTSVKANDIETLDWPQIKEVLLRLGSKRNAETLSADQVKAVCDSIQAKLSANYPNQQQADSNYKYFINIVPLMAIVDRKKYISQNPTLQFLKPFMEKNMTSELYFYWALYLVRSGEILKFEKQHAAMVDFHIALFDFVVAEQCSEWVELYAVLDSFETLVNRYIEAIKNSRGYAVSIATLLVQLIRSRKLMTMRSSHVVTHYSSWITAITSGGMKKEEFWKWFSLWHSTVEFDLKSSVSFLEDAWYYDTVLKTKIKKNVVEYYAQEKDIDVYYEHWRDASEQVKTMLNVMVSSGDFDKIKNLQLSACLERFVRESLEGEVGFVTEEYLLNTMKYIDGRMLGGKLRDCYSFIFDKATLGINEIQYVEYLLAVFPVPDNGQITIPKHPFKGLDAFRKILQSIAENNLNCPRLLDWLSYSADKFIDKVSDVDELSEEDKEAIDVIIELCEQLTRLQYDMTAFEVSS